ncbi:LytTR family transcriptional regulator DNA-binding domain-containing protein [Flagellimonas myxillae]|uniref:LytTR family transcriptional regulator DNA-binding domain-containing protein n=1 Tax=Flagellimonas myxillae TaxID=2942214 RepID=UPI00201F5067|nr:LytTR family transcriptional regulator DNA-binding domain-containing protein [Muricauda myxillae]MCL6265072.1 LytTR family transcriptional regulator DNA-binding domain-containing protein [Muricauda myxillae]
MLADLNSVFYQYIRGGILVLCIYNLFVYFQNNNKQFLHYSLYFLCIFLFFLGQDLSRHGEMAWFHILTPSIHCGTFIFYLSFAREVLPTKKRIPKWDKTMLQARDITIFMVPMFLVIYGLFGGRALTYVFMVLGFATFVFSLCCYYFFLRIKNRITYLFLLGSFSYSVMATCSFFAGFSFGGYSGFIQKFSAHPTLFMYCGSLFEAIVFSVLIGSKIDILEKENQESIKRIDELKKIVVKNHIVLKDKTKVYISELVFIKADDHYLNLFLSNGKNHFVRGKLKSIKQELPPNFVQSHRSYIVNSNFIKQTNSDGLLMITNQLVPLSRSFKQGF